MLNIFVGGSGATKDFIVNDANGSVASHWGVDPSIFNIITVTKTGEAKFVKRVSGSKNATVTFQTYHYNVGEVENTGFYLENAVQLFRNAEGPNDMVNILGHSNGGNAVVRWLETYSPNYINSIVTAATPYNGKSMTVKQTGFVKEVMANKDKIKYNSVNVFVARDDDIHTFPSKYANDGVISEDSALCGSLVFPDSITVVANNQNHGTIMWSPEVINVVKKWF
ncbi:alpha/beta hydrolase [Companilactobacillus suantsaicola]|uniref:Alpha/beta hydrolase n=1 Tax=Companilactobacillus suantsaicola TaxID=2487723 RepID=A0A4Z0JDP8_9LACO|nr:alpha/beta hydrolase [Companilactobacillus suantsaicola]TGD20926.1 alpha/beta hydrolase [Companilactobacillus suantsaicola]